MKELKAIQTELKAPKNLINKFGGYHYRSCEGILEAVKPLLIKYNCHLTISDEVEQIGTRYYVRATATLTNSDGEREVTTALAREEESKKGMDVSQITGATSSYARKYALNGLFCIDDTKDADALNTHNKEVAQNVVQEQANEADDDLSDAEYEILNAIMCCNNINDLQALWQRNVADWSKDKGICAMVTRRKNELNNVKNGTEI